MRYFKALLPVFALLAVGCTGIFAIGDDSTFTYSYAADTSSPDSIVKICFIHHSTGSAWIRDGNGNLGAELNADNYYVTEADYGWSDPGYDQGSHTDTSDWPDWFTDTVMPHVYANDSHYDYSNTIADPGGENDIVMFKSCYPCSDVGDSIDDEKAIYEGLLDYFADHTDKMFILVIPPPMTDISTPELTRELANWLVNRDTGWLSDYPHANVYAFDYYNVLTDARNHHRISSSGREEHIVSGTPAAPAHPHELYYPTGDNHPSSDGHQKATEELLPLLNAWYHLWQND